jgi:hypothetical protein
VFLRDIFDINMTIFKIYNCADPILSYAELPQKLQEQMRGVEGGYTTYCLNLL